MPKRCRFVQPDVVRLFLVDVHKRAKQELVDKGKPIVVDGKVVEVNGKPTMRPATPDELAAAGAAIKQAEEDAEWVDVKAELNAGEIRHIFTDSLKEMRHGETATLDPEQVGLTKMAQYIVDWSLTDRQGNRVPFSSSALTNLDIDTYREISVAVDWHDEEVERKKTALKNAPTTANTLSAT